MTEPHESIDTHFFQLVLSLQVGAMQQMGKIASPTSGKIERDLEMAKNSIDMIAMLETKMTENMTETEKEFIGHVLYELRLNYVDEVKKDETTKAEEEPAQDNDKPAPGETESREPANEQNSSGAKPSDARES